MVKDSGLRIRVERELREKFVKLCRRQKRPAAAVVREFMQEYLKRHERRDGKAEHKHGRT